MNILDNLIQSYGLHRKGTGADSLVYNETLEAHLYSTVWEGSDRGYAHPTRGILCEINAIMQGSLSTSMKEKAIDDLVKNKIMPIVQEFDKEYDKSN